MQQGLRLSELWGRYSCVPFDPIETNEGLKFVGRCRQDGVQMHVGDPVSGAASDGYLKLVAKGMLLLVVPDLNMSFLVIKMKKSFSAFRAQKYEYLACVEFGIGNGFIPALKYDDLDFAFLFFQAGIQEAAQSDRDGLGREADALLQSTAHFGEDTYLRAKERLEKIP
ncbi:hypothetical protein [Rhizobium sp. 42MFCr.1]|uniref:hypothetical protein n=1 Tax=Rhizobium sp. 42MFCr.1 TaxID=1048680 RepID=UPI000360E92C|nr:hypothetical protein [Rhizobium sp. 42MFCr.1]